MSNTHEKWLSDVQAVRRDRLQHLIDTKFQGNRSELCRRIDKAPTQIGSVLKERRGFGEDLAREIESRCGLPYGWLDWRLVLNTTGAPQDVRQQIESLSDLAVRGVIEWDTVRAVLHGALTAITTSGA